MSGENLVPKLRFIGFDDEWQCKNIKDIGEIISGGTPKTTVEEYWNGEINWFTPSELNNQKYLYESERKITEKGLNNSSAKLLPINSILISSRATVGEVAMNKTESTTNQDFETIIPNKEMYNDFIYYSIIHLKNELLKMSYGSTFLSITKTDLGKIKLNYPQFNEQKKISDFLNQIDNKIQLLEEKHKNYQNLKKYLMQQIFAQKLRFDFNDEWNKVLLNDVAFIPKKTKLNDIDGLKLLTVKLHAKGIEINDRIKPKLTKRGRPYYIRKSGELLIGRQNFHNGGMGIVPQSLDGGICSNAISSFKVFEDKIDVNYLYYFLARPEYYIKSERLIGGTGQKEFSEKELLKLKIDLPSLEEQSKIVDLLLNMDNKIQICENQLNKTQEFKKGLLQQMFV